MVVRGNCLTAAGSPGTRLGLWDSLNNVTLYPSYWRTAHDRGCPNTWTVSQLDRISFFKLVPSMLYIQWVA
jgi:hypothetical protein